MRTGFLGATQREGSWTTALTLALAVQAGASCSVSCPLSPSSEGVDCLHARSARCSDSCSFCPSCSGPWALRLQCPRLLAGVSVGTSLPFPVAYAFYLSLNWFPPLLKACAPPLTWPPYLPTLHTSHRIGAQHPTWNSPCGHQGVHAPHAGGPRGPCVVGQWSRGQKPYSS